MNRLRRIYVGGLVLGSVMVLTAANTATLPAPPVAKKVPHVTEVNGHKMVDNYFWLRDKPNPEVRAYLEAENVYTDAVMKPTEGFQKKLYDEMLRRIKETDVEVPYREGDYFYYVRTEAGKQYGIRCRQKVSDGIPDTRAGAPAPHEEIVLDVNELAKGQAFMSVAAFAVSPDGNLLAYSYDNTGFRQYTLAVKDLRTGKTLADHAERVGSVVWANDNKTIFYTQEDAVSKRQYRLYRHTAGTSGDDPVVYEEKDERFEVDAGKTRSQAYIFLICAQPYDERGAVHSGGPADGGVQGDGAAEAGGGILSRPQRGEFLYSGERYGAELPAGKGSGERRGKRELEGSGGAGSEGDARRHGFLQELLRAV